MKKARSKYHYLLRALKKKKHCKTKISVSKSLLRSNKTCYWKASRAIRKIFSCTNVVDGVEGGPKIARLFKDKIDERLFSSVKCSEDEHNLLATNIDLEAESYCSNAEICEGNECTHCHVISSSDVMSAIGKLKTDISDYGLVYSNNFTLGTELLFQYLRCILYTSMIYCGFCPASFICKRCLYIPDQ